MIVKPAKLDPKIPTRSIDFTEALRVLALSEKTPRTYTELQMLSQHIVVDRKQRPLKKSGFYRNWKALEVLGLIAKDSSLYRATPRGRAVLAAFRNENSELGNKTKRLLRRAMLRSEIARHNFFALFATEKTVGPLKYTAAVALSITKKRGTEEYQLENVVTGHQYILQNRLAQGIMWGLRRWAIDIELADELYARPQDGVSGDLSQIIYLVNPDRSPSAITKQFESEIENLITQSPPEYGSTVRLPISRLFYQICPKVQISTSTAQAELVKWLNRNKNRAFVEGASRPVVRNVRRTNRIGSRISWDRQAPALLEINGQYYTSLFCRKSGV